MVIVVGYLVAAVAAIVIAWLAAGRDYTVARHAGVDLGELGGRHVSILGSLSGFAVTGMVLLVTLGRGLPDTSGLTTVLTMFFVAYMGYFATSLLFANVHDPDPISTTHFDVTGAAYASAAVTLYFSTLVGWLALRPMFETFGLPRMVDVAGSLLTVATVLGSIGFGIVTALPLLNGGPRIDRILARYARFAVLGYAQGAIVLVVFLLLSVLGLA